MDPWNEFLALPDSLERQWKWTLRSKLDAEQMSSKLQGQWMIWTSHLMAPKRGQLHFSLTLFASILGRCVKNLHQKEKADHRESSS